MVASVAGTIVASSAADANWNSATVQVGFLGTSLPAQAGTYKITSMPLTDNERSVSFAVSNSGNAKSYSASDANGKTAAVNINRGKVQVIIPDIWAIADLDLDDSVQASANFQQK